MTDVFFKHPSRMAIVTRMDLAACTSLLQECLHENCWSSSVAVSGDMIANAGTMLGIPRHWADDTDLASLGVFLRGNQDGNRASAVLRHGKHVHHHHDNFLSTITPMAERFLGLLQELRSRLVHMHTWEQQWAYTKGAVIDVVRFFGESCGDAWEDMGQRNASPSWPGEAAASEDETTAKSTCGVVPGHGFVVRPLMSYWTVRVGALNTMKLAAEILRAWGEQDADDVKFASLLKWQRDKSFSAKLRERLENRRRESAQREQMWRRRDSNDSVGIAASMSEFISMSPLTTWHATLASQRRAWSSLKIRSTSPRVDSDIR